MTPIIAKIKTQRFLDLGVPGGYEQFNYAEAYRTHAKMKEMEAMVKQRLREGLLRMMGSGMSLENSRKQKELDDIFEWDEESEKKSAPGSSRRSLLSEGGPDSEKGAAVFGMNDDPVEEEVPDQQEIEE